MLYSYQCVCLDKTRHAIYTSILLISISRTFCLNIANAVFQYRAGGSGDRPVVDYYLATSQSGRGLSGGRSRLGYSTHPLQGSYDFLPELLSRLCP